MRLLTLRPIWLRYGLSVFFCIFAALLTLELGPRLAQTPSPLFFAAVLFSAWYGGLGPGILASIISTLLLHTLFLTPTGSLPTLILEDAAALAVFLIVTLMTAWLTTLQQRNQLQLQQRFAQLQSLHRLTQALSQAASLEQIYDEALTNLKQTLGADRASILLYDSDEVMRFKAWQGLSEEYRQKTEGHSPWTPDEPNPAPVLVPDVEQAPSLASLRDTILQEGIRALAFIPLVSQGRLLGKFMIYHNQPHAFSEAEVQLAQTIASHIAFAIERKRVETDLQEGREQLRVTLASIGDAVITTDTQGRVTFLNDVAQALTGWSHTEAVDKPLEEIFRIINEETRAEVENPIARVIREGMIVGLANHTLLIRRDGQEVPIDDSGAPIRNRQGEFIGVVLVFRDIRERRQAEVNLRESEERYRTLVTATTSVVWTADAEGKFVTPQPAWEAYTGQTWEEYKGWGWAQALHPQDREQIKELWARKVAGRAIYQSQGRLWHTGSRAYRHFVARAAPVFTVQGEVREWIGTITDIHEQKETERALENRARQQAAVAELGQRALMGTELDALINEAVHSVAETLGVEFVKVLELLPDGEAFRLRAGVGWREGLVGTAIVSAGQESQAGYTLLSGTPVIVTDLRTETRFTASLLRNHGVISGLSVMIRGQERPFGVVGAHTTQLRIFTQDDVYFLRAMANVLAEAIARQRIEDALRLSRDQTAAILHGIAEGVTVQEPSGRLVYSNDFAAQTLGYPSAEALLATPLQQVMQKFELLDESGEPFPITDLPGRRALEGETNASAIVRFRTKDTGEERWSDVQARPIFNAQGQVAFAVNIFHDITTLKRAEHHQRILAEAGKVLSTSLDYQERLSRVAQLVVPHLADWCIIEMLDEQTGEIRPMAMAHVDPAKVEQAQAYRQSYPADPYAPGGVANVLRTGQSEFYPDISDEMLLAAARSEEHLRTIREVGMKSVMIVPLTARGRTLGVLTLVWAESNRHHTSEDLALAEELARRTAVAVDNARLYEAEQRARSEAQRLNAELEARVRERTSELQFANVELENEIAARRRMEEKIRESERMLAEAQQIAQLGSWHWDILTDEITWSQEMYRIYGLAPEGFNGTYAGFLELVHPDDRARVNRTITQALQDNQPFWLDYHILWPEGTLRTLHTRGEVTVDENGQPAAIAGVAQDITERMRIEEELRTSQEQLRQLSVHLQEAREEERSRLAREVHDELGGALTALKMDVAALRKSLGEDQPALLKRANAMSELIDSTVQTIRRIATDLRPGILDDFGLMAAIEWQLQEFQTRAGIECRLSSKVGHLNLDPETSTALFRVFQETLTNVARHANATQVEVLLEEQPNALLLQVRDNGRGISERETFGTKSLGLLGIRERVRLLSGELSIQGNPGKGTTVQVRIPLDGSQPGQSASETEPAQ